MEDDQVSITLLLDPQFMGPAVPLADGQDFPRHLEVWAHVNGTPVTLWLVVEDGKVVLDRVHIGRPKNGEPLRASTVHSLPFDRLIKQALRDVGAVMVKAGINEHLSQGSYGRRIVTDSLLREVAAIVKGDPTGRPNQAVQEGMHTSARNASRWITAARTRGFLDSHKEGDK